MPVIAALAQLGVILLLFEVGLESNLGEMLEVGWSSLFVAVAGVVALFFLGWGVSAYFLPDASRLAHVFIGSVLCATSVGITARVLKDLGKLSLRESRIILGAAVIDDVIGLLILAVLMGAITATMAGGSLSVVHLLLARRKNRRIFCERVCCRTLCGAAPLSRRRQVQESRRSAGVIDLVLFLAFVAGNKG